MFARVPLLPTLPDVLGLFDHLLSNPHLFITSTTVVTSALVTVAVCSPPVMAGLRLVAPGPGDIFSRSLARIAPALALIFMYFGVGALALSTEILIRFHSVAPATTELQFRSGVGHFAVAFVGVLALVPWLRGRSARTWLDGNLRALLYWTIQVVVLTPPWFSFQGQRALVLVVAGLVLALSATMTILLMLRLDRRAAT